MTMTKEELRELFKEKIGEYLPEHIRESCTVECVDVMKNNDTVLKGLTFNRGNGVPCPTFYIEDAYDHYLDGVPPEALMMELAENFLAPPRNSWRAPMLFYVWGHSYEFDDMDNWNVIEEFAEFMGGREDIWYATNMEIYEYVQAYNRLETSYDKTFVYNPSNITVWFWHQGKDYCVEPGQTITL